MDDNDRQIEFNLLDEGWIRVLLPDCSVREVSLPDALLHSHEYVDLAGEMPTQDVAVLRLLLAVLHTVFSRVDVQGEPAAIQSTEEAIDRWKALWREGKFPEEPIRSYLNKWRDRFWLFHPDRPFWQVLEAVIGTEGTAAKLNGEMMESNNKLRLFPFRQGSEKNSVSYSEAARWLLHLNGFDDTAAKPKGKDLPSPGTGWLGKLGLITCVGKTLFETLMLNMVLFRERGVDINTNIPSWELPKAGINERTEITFPNNPAALLTLQSRRLLLKKQNGKVSGYYLLGGDFFQADNAFDEPMTVWKRIREKGKLTDSYRPVRHDPSKQMWREFPTIFIQQSDQKRPGVVDWTKTIKKAGIGKRLLCFRIVGTQYGDKDFFVEDIFSDELSLSADLLSDAGLKWQQIIKDELERCEKAAYEVEVLAKRIDQAVGNDRSGLPKRAKEQYYDRLNQPFRLWLERIDPEKDDLYIDEAVEQWRGTARRIADVLGRELIQKAGPAAIVGREIKEESKGKKKAVFCSAPDAYNWFCYRISKIFE